MIKVEIPNHDDYGKWLYKDSNDSLFIMGNHKFALYAWMLASSRYDLKDATLVHFDYHYDYAVDDWIKTFLNSPSPHMAFDQVNFSSYNVDRVMHDSFLPAAIGAGLFKECIFICKEDPRHEDLQLQVNGRKMSYKIFQTIEVCHEYLKSEAIDKLCLDIDLDYFNNSTNYNEVKLDDDHVINRQLSLLRSFNNVLMTTIAVSEDFSGGIESSKKLLEFTKKIWGIEDSIENSLDASSFVGA